MSGGERTKAAMVAQVLDFMRNHKLTFDDLFNVGGDDLRSSNKSKAGKARCVDNCWSLMARLGVKHLDIEHFERASLSAPGLEARIRRGEEAFLKCA